MLIKAQITGILVVPQNKSSFCTTGSHPLRFHRNLAKKNSTFLHTFILIPDNRCKLISKFAGKNAGKG